MNDIKVALLADKSIAILSINRPEKRNAFRMETIEEMAGVIQRLEDMPQIRCTIITGESDNAFSSGGDMRAELQYSKEEPWNLKKFNDLGGKMVLSIINSRMPYIAAVNGFAFGAALSVITACDFSLASENAVFAIPTSSMGGVPGWGCTQLLPRAIGKQRAQRILLGNERIGAVEAYSMGLIGEVVKSSALMPKVMEQAERIAFYPPQAITAIKIAVNHGLEDTLEKGIALEGDMLMQVNPDSNFQEGLEAFFEKRTPIVNYDQVFVYKR
ncbi:enoyl-CoA hydratase/isomerase family protein [Sporomusa sp. KB1]|jgi:enoyl-CoA hydratase|uniref:enoyl-CoA hydratase/isomerase family protein n=1 Tax=Sporomusa sp. KB1 TaxID=943346 RepID=UPI0011A2ADD1|nr:enoyl-CoA hydratase/isomerase family protein [Sporomusa sp. KB1]TWH45511.1 enoyl-CoA hydratase [Sporomusa sp. KB1]